MTEKIDIVDRLRSIWHDNDCTRALIEQAVDEIERLRAERDEARMKFCKSEAAARTQSAWSNGILMRYLWQDIAREQGWDCFKEKP
jgi:hypothetical protein